MNNSKAEEKLLIQRVKDYVKIIKNSDTLTRKQKLMLSVLPYTKGIVSQAASKAGISSNVHYDAMHNCKEYREFYKMIENDRTDFVESCLLKGIENLDASLIKFYLTSKAKDRGYSENNVNLNIAPITFVMNFDIPEEMSNIEDIESIEIEEAKLING